MERLGAASPREEVMAIDVAPEFTPPAESLDGNIVPASTLAVDPRPIAGTCSQNTTIQQDLNDMDEINPVRTIDMMPQHESLMAKGGSGAPATDIRDGQPATDEEIRDLLHVVDRIPARVWLAMLVGVAERFIWYGNTAPLQNYLQQSPSGSVRGALGLSQVTASNIVSAVLAASYFTPVPAAVLADSWLGRYRALVLFYMLVLVGALILFVTSLPGMLERGVSEGGVYTAMVLMSFGSGGVKAVVSPFIADQYVTREPTIKVLKSGEVAVTDRELTIQYIYNALNWLTNIGGLAALVTTLLERYVSFWAAYLPPLCVAGLGALPLFIWGAKFVREPPVGSIIPHATQALTCAVRGGFKMVAAKPQSQQDKRHKEVPWDDQFVDELKSGLRTCRILLVFPIHWLCLNQTFNNLISQAGTMVGSGVPNDTIKSVNPISIVIFAPLVQKLLYPYLTRRRIRFHPIARITVGFALLSVSMAITTGVQKAIYSAGPCYDHPLDCPAADGGRIPNQVSMFLQVPIYAIGGLAEIFCYVTGLEYSYNQAPKSMRSIVQAYWLSMAGFGSVLSIALTPLAKDPHFVTMYAVLTGLMAGTTVLFWAVFGRGNNKAMEML